MNDTLNESRENSLEMMDEPSKKKVHFIDDEEPATKEVRKFTEMSNIARCRRKQILFLKECLSVTAYQQKKRVKYKRKYLN